MKINVLSILFILLTTFSFAQNASNFTAKDCSGITHDLFAELESGKVVVLCWVMPCGSCVYASLTTYTVVQGYEISNPNSVYFYLVDDIGDATCTSLTSWGKNNGLRDVVAFSDTSIRMTDYGIEAMPKVVVLGGASHQVFLVADFEVDPVVLQESIDAALITAGIPEETNNDSWAKIFPNPANDKLILTIHTENPIPVKADVFSIQGEKMETIFNGIPSHGELNISVDLSEYLPGVYFIRLGDAEKTCTIKFTVKP